MVLGHAPHAEIGAAIAIEIKGQAYAPIHDLSGNIAMLLPFDGSHPLETYYSAFGEEIGSCLSPWRFSSKRVDDKTDLVYYGRRFYQRDLGRWLSPDPAGFTDGMNLYAFVHNNPLTHFDEYGLLSMVISAPSLLFEKDSFKMSRHFASMATHEIYNNSIGLFGPSAWNQQNHLAFDRFFRTSFTELETARAARGVQFAYGELPTPHSPLLTVKKIMACNKLAKIPVPIAKPGAKGTCSVKDVLKVGKFTYTDTAAKHLTEVVKKGPNAGKLSRPYMKSQLTIEEIMAAGKPIPDPGGIPGGLRWDVPGALRGNKGTWELVLHPEKNVIYHFNFK